MISARRVASSYLQNEIEREAGLKDIGKKVKDLGGKAVNLIKEKFLPKVVEKVKGGL